MSISVVNTTLIALVIVCSVFALLVAFRYVSQSDPFSFLVLFSIPLVFLLVIRPLAFVFLEDFDGPYLNYRPGIDRFVLATIALNALAYVLVIIGYAQGVKRPRDLERGRISHILTGRIRFAAWVLFATGFVGWLFLMQQGGGLLVVLRSLALRNTLFLVDGGYWLLTFTKSLIMIGTILLACTSFVAGRVFRGWAISILGFLLILGFGGRGAAMSLLIGAMISYHYAYRRIRLRWLALAGIILLPVLLILGELRLALTGNDQVTHSVEINAESLSSNFVRLSYLHRAFDYNVLFLQKHWEDGLSYFGEYPHGLTALIPRSIYPDKADLLGSRLASSLYGIEDYGISPSFTVGIVSTWGILSLPFFALLLGYCGARFWSYFAFGARGDPRKLVVYSLFWPIFASFFFDLASTVLSLAPILIVLFLAELFLQIGRTASGPEKLPLAG